MDTKDLEKFVKNFVRVGVVSSVDEAAGTVKVTFEDRDNTVSADLPTISRGSLKNKDYWLPDINEEVVCIFMTNDKNLSTGWVLGTHFSDKAPPNAASLEKRRFDFGDGTFFEYDRGSHELTINCVGNVNIKGANVYIN